MTQRLTNRWYKRLIWIVLATLLSASWQPTYVAISGNAKRYNLTKGTDCFMDPEFFRDSGVSGRQICTDYRVNVSMLITVMVLGAMVPCVTLAIRAAWRFLNGPVPATPDQTAAATAEPQQLTFPTYAK